MAFGTDSSCLADSVLFFNFAKAKDKTLKPNTPVSLYLGPGMTELDQSDLAKAEGGRYLKGSLTILKDDVTKKVEKHRYPADNSGFTPCLFEHHLNGVVVFARVVSCKALSSACRKILKSDY